MTPSSPPCTGRGRAKVTRYINRVLSMCGSEACHGCGATPPPTRYYCKGCGHFHCKSCLQMDQQPVVPVVTCLDCRVQEASERQWLKKENIRRKMRALAQAEILMENKALRGNSVANIGRARKDYIKFADAHHLPPIPESQAEVSAYITYSLHQRVPTLDSSTLTNYVAGNGTFIAALRAKLDIKLFNPIRGLRIKSLMKVARDDYKKESKAKLPWTIKEFKRMLDFGFPKTRTGRH
jgi:hypothetical protein